MDLRQDVRDSFKASVGKKGIKMSLETSGQLIIKSYKRRTKQVVMNLVSNAIKHTARGEIAINTTKKDDLSLTGFIENKIKNVSHIAGQGG